MTNQEIEATSSIFRRKITWAILSTNLFAQPLILVFIIVILNLGFGQIGDALRRDPYFLVFGVGVFFSVALFFDGAHFLFVLRFLKPIFDYLNASEQGSEESLKDRAYQALLNSLRVPQFTMVLSIILYVIGIMVILALVQILYRFTLGQNLSLFFVSLSMGVIISFFQFFTTRRVLIQFMERILIRFPEFVENDQLNALRIKMKDKMLVAVLILCLTLVTITGVLGYNYALSSFQIRDGQLYLTRLNLLGEVYQPGSEHYFRLFTTNLRIDYEDQIFLTDAQGNIVNGEVKPSLEKIWKFLLGTYSPNKLWSRPMIFKISAQEIYSAVHSHQRYTVVHRGAGDQHHLFIIVPEAKHERALSPVWIFTIIASLGALILGFIYTRLATSELDMPLHTITEALKEVAGGNFQKTVKVISQDEIGIVAFNLSKMISNLRAMIGKIDSAGHSITQTSGQLAYHTEQTEQGAGLQASSVEETSASIEEMNQANKQIAESIETLARSAEESSASILEMGAIIDEVAKNVETLSEAVEETTSSLQEMNASLQEVASNVQQLSTRSQEAMRTLEEMENAIRSVGDSSNQTAILSEQVAEDANQGTKAMELTMKGIERIRHSSEEAAMVIDSLSERIQEIGNILNVIDDITEETNLLALNAAIIAAQAGEHGKGFAVVADEIRDLAERTSASTKEIAELIKAVQEGARNAVATVFKGSKDVEKGVQLSQEAGAALSQILKRARTSMERTREIAGAMTRQKEHTKEVRKFFENINTMITQVAQAIQEQTKGSDLIFKASQRMEQVAQQVKRATREQTLGSKQITQAIENIAQIVNYINTAQSDQLRNSQTVLEAVRHIRTVAEENTERVKELRRVVEALNFLSQDLNEMVQQFKFGEFGKEETEIKEVFKL